MAAWDGSCHCGAVRFHVAAEVDEVTSCDCSLCSRRNARMIKNLENMRKIGRGE